MRPRLAAVAAAAGVAEFEPEFPPAPGTSAFAFAPLSEFLIARLAPGAGVDRALAALRRSSGIADAWAIAVLPVSVAAPNDSLWPLSHHLDQPSMRDVRALAAWDTYRGDSSVVIAILDTGILPWHPDLGGLTAPTQLWTHAAELHGQPGVDDDGNGYVDDFWGWDFVASAPGALADLGEDWRDADNDPVDFAGHGTAIAGLIGGRVGNRIGVAGLVPDVRLMALRVGWATADSPTGEVAMSYVAQAVQYATRMGVDAINCSFATTPSPDLDAAVDAAIHAGVVVVTASGNNGTEHALGDRGDVIAATAVDDADQVPRFANRGAYVTLAAPGFALPATVTRRTATDSIGARQPSYTTGATGTSFSAALVSGAVGLVQGDRRRRHLPPLTPAEMQLRLAETADDITGANLGLTGFGAGRLNVARALTDPPGSRIFAAGDTSVGPVAALGLDGPRPVIASAASDGALVIREGLDGSVVVRAPLPAAPAGGVAAAALGDGRGLALFVPLADGRLAGVDESGDPLPGWPVDPGATSPGALPALGDVDGDGRLDVVVGGRGGIVRALNAFGEPLPGFPVRVAGDTADVHVALASLDTVPGLEIVVAASDGTLGVLARGGVMVTGWPRATAAGAGAPVVISGDSSHDPEIVVAAGESLFGFDPTGEMRWRQYLDGPAAPAPAVADLDGDGADEILVPLLHRPRVQVFDAQGTSLAPLDWSARSATPCSGEPLVGTLVRATDLDVVVFVPGLGSVAFDRDGAVRPGWPRPGRAGGGEAFGDVDRDGTMDLIAPGGVHGELYLYAGARGGGVLPRSGWSTARGDPARTGSRFAAPVPGESDTSRGLLVSRATIALGDVWLGTSSRSTFHVIDATTDTLMIDVTGAAAPFDVAPASFRIEPGRAQQVTVSATPTACAASAIVLAVRDRSGIHAGPEVRVTATGIAPPRLVVTPDSVRATLARGDSGHVTLTLENRGDAPLELTPALELQGATAALRGAPRPSALATGAVHGTLAGSAPALSAAAGGIAILAANTKVAWLESLLADLGFTVLRLNPEVMNPDTLALSRVVVVALDGGWVPAAAVRRLADAARAGATVVMLGGTRYPAFATALGTEMIANAGPRGWSRSAAPGFVLRAPGTALADSLPATHAWRVAAAAYSMLQVTDPVAQVIAADGHGAPWVAAKRLGLGSLLLWTGTPTDAAWSDPDDRAVIRRVVTNAIRTASEWVSLRTDPLRLAPGAAQPFQVVLSAVGRNTGTLDAALRLDSNDPARPVVRIPIRLDVTAGVKGGAR